jgi:hypothetical protein
MRRDESVETNIVCVAVEAELMRKEDPLRVVKAQLN